MSELMELKIDEVLLQPDFAVIKRRGQLEIASGRNSIQITNLDPNLNEDSIRLIVSGESIVIHNIKFQKEEVEPDETITDVENKIDSQEEEIEILESKLEDEEFWLDYYDKIRGFFADFFAKGYATAKISIEEYTNFSEFIENKLKDHESLKEKYTTQKEELEENVSNLEDELEELKEKQAQLERGFINLIIDNASEQQIAEFQLEYYVNAGSWNMFYELEHTNDSVSLKKWVSITNSSIESWDDVIITVTDKVHSDLSIDLPSLAYMNPEEGIESDFLIPVQSIKLSGRVTVIADNTPYRFEIGDVAINEISYRYYWNAYDFENVVEILILSLKNDYFYPGPINIFYNGVFIDTINHIDFSPPDEEIGIPLREVNTFKVSKISRNKVVQETGILKKQVETTYKYQLMVKNPFESNVELVVHDRIPKPQIINSDKDLSLKINVDYKQISSHPHEVYESGLVRWKFDLEPQQEESFDFNIHLVKGE